MLQLYISLHNLSFSLLFCTLGKRILEIGNSYSRIKINQQPARAFTCHFIFQTLNFFIQPLDFFVPVGVAQGPCGTVKGLHSLGGL